MQVAEEVRTYTCTCCPLGCRLEVAFDESGEVAEVSGYSCLKGKEYAISEATDPRRMVTSSIPVSGCMEPLSVKTAAPVPKHLVRKVLEAIDAARPDLPIKAGDIVIEDVCATGIAVVATKTLPCS